MGMGTDGRSFYPDGGRTYVVKYDKDMSSFYIVVSRYVRVTSSNYNMECAILDHPDGGGYIDAYQCASTKCILPNLLQPIVENRSRQPLAIGMVQAWVGHFVSSIMLKS